MRKEKRVIYGVSIAVISLVLIVLFLSIIVFFSIYRQINFEGDELLFERSGKYESTAFYAEDKHNLGEYIAVERLGGIRKIYYPLEEIPEYLKDGIIAVEDKIFYEHRGVDTKRTFLAAINYLLGRDEKFGASTVTQQVVKNISGDKEQTVRRKVTEMIRAHHIEKKYDKDEILELYLNIIPFGENSYGVGAASRAYFGKEPMELSAAEAATLIGITNAPSAYSPYSNPELCKKKRDIVLSVMRVDGVISAEEYHTAVSSEVDVMDREAREDRLNSWFCEVVTEDAARELSKKYGISESAARVMLYEGGYSIYTTMDPEVQSILEEYFENTDNFPDETNDGLNYAMAITDARTGYLVGVVGRVGEKQGNRLLNHATAPHTPGSVLKPIALYAPLIDEGKINSATVFDDVPVSFAEGREYPKNSPNIYDGLITVKDAVRLSKNTVAVRLCNLRTPRAVFDSLRSDYGFSSLVEKESVDGRTVTDVATAPMALGQLTRGVSLLKLTESYGVFPGEGAVRPAKSFTRIVDYEGKTVIELTEEKKQVIKPETAGIMNMLLMGVVEDGTAGRITLGELVETAGKTGTSGGNRDKMFIGYTPYYVAGIWCGYDGGDGQVANLSPSHLEIWDDIMWGVHLRRLKNEAVVLRFSREGLIEMSFCRDSGELYDEVCRYDARGNRRDTAYFTYDNRPEYACNRHVLCLYDTESKGISTGRCPNRNLVAVSLIKVESRSFPREIFITDAEYVYRDMPQVNKILSDPSKPYFYPSIPEGEYVGISDRKRQFNCACDLH